MKQALAILSLYCKGVNEQLIGILEGVPGEKLQEDMQTYFKSIAGTLNHMTRHEINWLIRLRDIFPASPLAKAELLRTTAEDLQAGMERNYRETFSLRKRADILFEEFIRELKDEELEQVINYKSKHGGGDQSAQLGHILLQLFMHQTHHRGAISAMLDRQGIDNDYSGLLKHLPVSQT